MCGIVALFSPRGTVALGDVERATEQLIRRGPDGQRQWMAPHGRVGLGHARLSIIDLATGDQPIASEDGRIHTVVNGEFYDFERIQRELVQQGHTLKTKSDSEIALHLYEDLGPGCLEHLRGEFALVIWDEPNQLLFAARDRFGIKPLFFAQHGGTLYLASEVKALFAAGVPARWNPRRGVRDDGRRASHSRRCTTASVRCRPATTCWRRQATRSCIGTGTSTIPKEDGRAPLADEEYAERLHHALDDAVRLRLRADVPVGCYLSGGLDSCTVLGLAAKHRVDPIRAFTLTFDRADYDESVMAEEMAALAGAEYYPVPIRQADLADHFFDATW